MQGNKLRIADYYNKFLDLFYPPKCIGCGNTLPLNRTDAFCNSCRAKWDAEKNTICGRCNQNIKDCWCGVPSDKDKVISFEKHLVNYDKQSNNLVKKVIYLLKNSNSRDAFKYLSKDIADDIVSTFDMYDLLICPVPRSPKSKRKIGHDQSLELCRYLSKETDIPVINVIEHTGNIKQKSLSHDKRQENANKSYRIKNGSAPIVKGKNIIIVDDVITTGSTVTRIAKLLKMRGANKVIVITIAKAI